MALPRKARPEDIKAIVLYLKNKPLGASEKDARAALGTKRLDPRKLHALLALGVVARDGATIKLTEEVGRAMARASDEQFQELLSGCIRKIVPYSACLEWAYHQRLKDLTGSEAGAYWSKHHKAELGTQKGSEVLDRAVCFLKLAEGAGLGIFVEGRRGHPSRLSLKEQALKRFIETADTDFAQDPEVEEDTQGTEHVPPSPGKALARGGPQEGIFIAHGKTKKPVEQLEKILQQFKINYKVAVREPNLGRPISTKVSEIMKSCNCAILIFTADEEFRDKDGNPIWRPSENVVYELGAASFLYENRVVIMKEEQVNFPTNFRDIGYIAFQKNQLEAKALEIIRELVGFGIVKITT